MQVPGLTVTSPQRCPATDSVEVRAAPDCAGLLVPIVITPNDDGQNDAFVLGGLVAADWTLAVYNRWGREVFRQVGYDNFWAGPAAGQYYYLLVNPKTGTRLQGWLEVVR